VETAWRKISSKAHYQEKEEKEDQHVLKWEHNIMDWTQARTTDNGSGVVATMSAGQPTLRLRMAKTRLIL